MGNTIGQNIIKGGNKMLNTILHLVTRLLYALIFLSIVCITLISCQPPPHHYEVSDYRFKAGPDSQNEYYYSIDEIDMRVSAIGFGKGVVHVFLGLRNRSSDTLVYSLANTHIFEGNIEIDISSVYLNGKSINNDPGYQVSLIKDESIELKFVAYDVIAKNPKNTLRLDIGSLYIGDTERSVEIGTIDLIKVE